MEKRRQSGLRMSDRKLRKSKTSNQGSSLIKKINQGPSSPQVAAILTENQGDESQLGHDDGMGRSPLRNQFVVGGSHSQLSGVQVGPNNRSGLHQGSRNHHVEEAEFDYGEDDASDEEESDDYDQEQVILSNNHNRL